MNVVFRADGGPDIGYGHLIRTGAIAEEFLNDGHQIIYATTTPDHVRKVCPNPVQILELPSRDDPEPLLDRMDGVDAVIADAYPVDTEYQRKLREQTTVAVFSDDSGHVICADVVINGNLYARELDYSFTGKEPTWCLGLDFTVFRREIKDLAALDPPWRDPPEYALITMGGSDVANVTPDAIRAFDGFDISVEIIVGPGFSNLADIDRAVVNTNCHLSISRDPPDLAERMFDADFAIGACGSTTYELLALGTPLICCPVVANQQPIADALYGHEAATVLGSGIEQDELREAIRLYIMNAGLRKRRRDNGKRMIDGRGTDRVYRKIVSATDRNATS